MSRFAKLVNAQAAREQEAPRETQELPPIRKVNEKPESTPRTRKSTPVVTPVATGVTTPVEDSNEPPRDSTRTSPQYLDATHTASEQRVYSVMYRETVSRGVRERHFGPKELCEKTGIRSDRTIRTALDGLIVKLSIEIVSNSHGSPLGPRYRVLEPKEIIGRRKSAGIEIDTQSKKILTPVATGVATPVATPVDFAGVTGVTGVKTTGVTGVDFAGVYNKYINTIGANSAAGSSSNISRASDDEAYALLLSQLRQAVWEVTGRESTPEEAERWGELADLLVTELKIAAGRTGSVSSVPAFLTEHLRRRLWKKDKRQLDVEERSEADVPRPAVEVDAAKCPDCFGTGMWYPEGFDKGVARCVHEKLRAAD